MWAPGSIKTQGSGTGSNFRQGGWWPHSIHLTIGENQQGIFLFCRSTATSLTFFFLDLVPWPEIKHYPPAESLTTGTPRKSHYFLDFWLLQGTGGGNMGSFQPFTSTSGYLLYTAGITERYGVFLHPAAWSVSLGPLLAIFSHGQGLLLSSSPLSTTYCSSTPITKGWKKSLN